MNYQTDCRFFTGYKPCGKSAICSSACPHKETVEHSILLVHLGALGAVLRTTSLLPMIKRLYPSSSITWVTEDNARGLLEGNSLIDRVLGINSRDLLVLESLSFDIGFFVDKSPEVEGLRRRARVQTSYGFGVGNNWGGIVPLNREAHYLWDLGLNNEKKFFVNTKTEQQLLAEAFELPYEGDEYVISLSDFERKLSQSRRQLWSENGAKMIVGLNTGTSGILPHKTIPNTFWIALIQAQLIKWRGQISFVLLGAKGESSGHDEILAGLEASDCEGVFLSPLDRGLRDGLCSVEATDLIVSGDSLGMHMGIGLKKYVVAWFGPTCAHEIDLYGRGEKVLSTLPCSPCWKRGCDVFEPCNQKIDLEAMEKALDRGLHKLIGSSAKPQNELGELIFSEAQ